MDLRVEQTGLPGVLLITPRVFGDRRGFFQETYQEEKYRKAGIPGPFVQDNFSRSCQGTLRGLHYQWPCAQGKLVSVLAGEVYDVAVDIRQGSPSFGKWVGLVLSGENHQQLYIPEGFAHGFCVLSEQADFVYKCTTPYAPAHEHGLCWSDPALGIAWPLRDPVLSEKDGLFPALAEVPVAHLPEIRAG